MFQKCFKTSQNRLTSFNSFLKTLSQMKRTLIIFQLFCLITLFASKQALSQCTNTLILQPNAIAGTDALVASFSGSANTNFGNNPDIDADAWTIGGDDVVYRGYLRFDLTTIPVNAIIQQATLTLFNNPTSTNGWPPGSHSSFSISNESWLQKVISPWNENTITWNNQPASDTTGEIALPQSISPQQDYIIDMTNLIQGAVSNPSNNYGFVVRMQTEVQYGALVFASSDYPDSTKHPKLVLSYFVPLAVTITSLGSPQICSNDSVLLSASPVNIDFTYQWQQNGININGADSSFYYATSYGNYTCVATDSCDSVISNIISVNDFISYSLSLQPDSSKGVDALVASYPPSVNTNFGNNPDIDADRWTISGDDVIFRGYFRFDVSSIPTSAIVKQAILTLFNNPSSSNGYPPGSHASQTASNESWLQKVIAPWNENTITWNNQPPVDTTGKVGLPQSTSPHTVTADCRWPWRLASGQREQGSLPRSSV